MMIRSWSTRNGGCRLNTDRGNKAQIEISYPMETSAPPVFLHPLYDRLSTDEPCLHLRQQVIISTNVSYVHPLILKLFRHRPGVQQGDTMRWEVPCASARTSDEIVHKKCPCGDSSMERAMTGSHVPINYYDFLSPYWSNRILSLS